MLLWRLVSTQQVDHTVQLEIDWDEAETTPAKPPLKHHKKPDTIIPGNAIVVGEAIISEKSSPLEIQFDKLWHQLQAAQRRNEEFADQLEEVHDWLNTELAETRTLYRLAMVKQTEKLISHLLKKSLAKWQRNELCLWIEENFSALETQGAPELQALVRSYFTNKVSQAGSLEREVIEAAFDTSVDDILAELADEFGENEDNFEDDLNEPGCDSADTHINGDEYDYAADSADRTAGNAAAEQAARQRVKFEKSMVSKLFRRTAKALHPDHEQDPQRREEKQALMKALLHARKTGNIATIFKLYRQHVSGEKINIEAPELRPMIDLLTHQVSELDAEYAHLSMETPIHKWVKNNFVGKSDKKRQAAFDEIKNGLEQDIQDIQDLAPLLNSLAKLKPLLEARYDSQLYSFY